ncbi:hypothetical protein PM082_010241 [Marasmius tenuissimus]|nr:hypothetical protein PM082_010241 [Marasmius tenuissimus]
MILVPLKQIPRRPPDIYGHESCEINDEAGPLIRGVGNGESASAKTLGRKSPITTSCPLCTILYRTAMFHSPLVFLVARSSERPDYLTKS